MDALENLAGSASRGIVGTDDELRKLVASNPTADGEYQDSGNRLRLIWHLLHVRQARKLGQRVVAKKMRTTQSVVSELEQGRTDPKLSALQRYARAIGCRIEITLLDDGEDGSGELWRSRIHFKTWKTRELPYNKKLTDVRVEKEPQKIWGSKLQLQYEAEGRHEWRRPWEAPTHSRHTLIKDLSVTPAPDDFLQSVKRG
jgi:transcriptional regulator with XRE-family HTH domain